MESMKNQRKRRFFAVLIMCIFMFTLGTICSATADEDAAVLTIGATESTESSLNVYEEECGDCEGTGFTCEHNTVCESCSGTGIINVKDTADSSYFASFWALIPPIIAIGLALITKEVYSSLFIGIVSGSIIMLATGATQATSLLANMGGGASGMMAALSAAKISYISSSSRVSRCKRASVMRMRSAEFSLRT